MDCSAQSENSASSALRTAQSSWLLRIVFAVAVLVTCGRIMAMNQADPDLWGHVQYGRDWIRGGALPRTTTWSFTAEGYRWINHENLAELSMAAVVDQFGPLGLTIGKYLLGLVVIGLIYGSGRRLGVVPLLMGLMCIVIALALEFHWHFRPQVFGYVLFTILALLLRDAFAVHRTSETVDGEDRKNSTHPLLLLCLIPLMAIWTNTHGSFAAGLAVAIATLGLRATQIIASNWHSTSSTEKSSSAQVGRSLLWIAVLSLGLILSTLANPYGLELYKWLWAALYTFHPEISDWETLPLWSGSREAACFWIIVTTALVAAWRDRRRDWPLIVVFLLVAWQSVSHIRHLPLLAILWGCWFALPLERLRRQFVSELKPSQEQSSIEFGGRQRLPLTPALSPEYRGEGDHAQTSSKLDLEGRATNSWNAPATVAVLAAWTLAMGLATWPRLSHLEVSRADYPVDAFRYMAEHRLSGRTVVAFNWAQFAIGFFAEQGLDSRVAFDGRLCTCYPQTILDRYLDFFLGDSYSGPRYRSPNSGPIDPAEALKSDSPELVLISRRQQPAVRVMEEHQDQWTLLYQDGLAQLWGRRDVFDDPRSPRFIAAVDRQVSDLCPHGSANYPALPNCARASMPLVTTTAGN